MLERKLECPAGHHTSAPWHLLQSGLTTLVLVIQVACLRGEFQGQRGISALKACSKVVFGLESVYESGFEQSIQHCVQRRYQHMEAYPMSRLNAAGHPRSEHETASESRRRSSTSRSRAMSPAIQHDEEFLEFLERILSRFCLALVPSYLQEAAGGEPPKPTRSNDIAALDGLRGWACLLVYNFHFLFTYTYDTHLGWGFANSNFGIHQLPIVHLLISGHVMVAIFFVISGYVLSFRPLKTIRSRSYEQTFMVLSSATFRRAFRLYLPTMIGMFCVLVAVQLGLFNESRRVVDRGGTITAVNEQHPPVMETTSEQLWDWYKTVVRLTNCWSWKLYYNNYNPHLWTIPVEFRCSIVLFLTLLAISRFTTRVRLILEALLIWFSARWGRWDVVLFLGGLVLVEIDLANGVWTTPRNSSNRPANTLPGTGEKPPESSHPVNHIFGQHATLFWKWFFVFGLYVASSPNSAGRYTPGFRWLAELTPRTYPEPHRFPQSLGAFMLVHAITNCTAIQRLFTAPISQYLGRISYAFYIVHGPILHGLGFALMPRLWAVTGRETNLQFCAGAAVGWSVCLVLSLWLADLFWRVVDVPCVSFTRWLEGKLLAAGN